MLEATESETTGVNGKATAPIGRAIPVHPSFIYFIQAEIGGLIKIGRSWDPETRLDTLQLSCPVKLTILATDYGGEAEERALHKRFKRSRAHGEWFRPVPTLLAHISSLQEPEHHKAITLCQLASYMARTGKVVTESPHHTGGTMYTIAPPSTAVEAGLPSLPPV